MKVLKVVERIVFLVAVILGAVALTFSLMLDEGAEEPFIGIATVSAAYVALGAGFVLLFLLVGALLRNNKNNVAAKIGEGFTLMAILVLFGTAAPVMLAGEDAGLTIMLAFVAGIIYAIDAIVRFIIFIVRIVKPEAAAEDPDVDERIQNILKWKKLCDDGIISKEEFEEKRLKILGLNEE